MRWIHAVTVSLSLLLFGVAGVNAADEPLSACFGAVGTYLTTNTNPDNGDVVGRSLISLTNGGHVFLTDSNEGGDAEFAPFTEGRGAWRCVSDEAGQFHILATVLDFTIGTKAFPDQQIARLDYDATYDESSETLSADVKLYFIPIDSDPMDPAMLKDAILNKVNGARITTP